MSRTKQKARRGGGNDPQDIIRREKSEVVTGDLTQKKVATTMGGKKRKLDQSDDLKTYPLPKRAALDTESEQSTSPGVAVDPSLLADHFAKNIQKWFSTSSPIELEDMYLPKKAFLDTTSYTKERLAANLPDFLEQFSAGGKEGLSICEEVGSPHTIVLAMSGMRIADLMRELRVFKSQGSKVGKFMPKHMKLEMNIKFLQSNKVGIAIGTPERLNQLLEAEALKTQGLQRIVVDGSYHDEKRSNIFTIGQIFRPMVAFLNDDNIRQRYGAEQNKVDIIVF
ncbi:hypothetical protein AYO21_06529 [Fonsecaea monophora]|uniref:Protein CMS1 n=1 Tax=Fonsecaea monophora TaxID=254056 RepID=A0A177F4Z4_9EURO|nr:hypothetical protein AYO21_06529 [Fonsecaea monophora]OAG39325.1 hypothetical protein AYO21_06529 [Fonsecaea monophora]